MKNKENAGTSDWFLRRNINQPDEIRHGFCNQNMYCCHTLNEYLSDLPLQENSQVFTLAGTLCAEHDRIAFFAGLQLGMQLMMELTEKTKSKKGLRSAESHLPA